MSTRATIYYNRKIHIYDELMDGTVHLSYHVRDFELDIKLPKKAIDKLIRRFNKPVKTQEQL